MPNPSFNTLQEFQIGDETARFHSLPSLGKELGWTCNVCLFPSA